MQERNSVQLHIYLTPAELAEIKKKAQEFNLSASTWGRLKLLGKI